MLSIESEARLAECFHRAAEDEVEVEYLRQVLSARGTFHPRDLFQRVDRTGAGFITLADLQDQAYMCGLQCSEAEAALVLRQYDGDLDGRLSFAEFCNMVLPAAKNMLRKEALQRRDYLLTSETMEVFAKLMQAELNCQRGIETARAGLCCRYDFNLLDAFRTIDAADWAYISVENLATFMQRRGVLFRPEQSEAAIRRVDVDNDGKVNYVEFVDFLLPCKEQSKLHISTPNSTIRTAGMSASPAGILKSTRNSTPLKSPNRSYPQTPNNVYSFVRWTPDSRERMADLEKCVRTDLEQFRALEHCREELVSSPDFSPIAVFRLMDKRDRGEVTEMDFRTVLTDLRVTGIDEEIKALFRAYSAGKQGRMSFSDISRLISPYSTRPNERISRGLYTLDNYRLSWPTTDKLAQVLQTALALTPINEFGLRTFASTSSPERLLEQVAGLLRLSSSERSWLLERYCPPALSSSQL